VHSYSCWLHAKHPDPTGEQLQHIAGVLREQWQEWKQHFTEVSTAP
jgi:hypothetical protein